MQGTDLYSLTHIYEVMTDPVHGVPLGKKSWLGFSFERVFVGTKHCKLLR